MSLLPTLYICIITNALSYCIEMYYYYSFCANMVTMHSMQRLVITSLQNGNVIMSVENHKCSENVPEVNSEGLN